MKLEKRVRFKRIPKTATVVAALAVLAGTSLVSAALLGKRADINPQADAPVEALHIRGAAGRPIVVAPSPQTGGTLVASVTGSSAPFTESPEAPPEVLAISPDGTVAALPVPLTPQETAPGPSPTPTPWIVALAAWGKSEISEVLDGPRGKIEPQDKAQARNARGNEDEVRRGKARGHYKGTPQGPPGLWRKGDDDREGDRSRHRHDGPRQNRNSKNSKAGDRKNKRASGQDKKTEKNSKARRQRPSPGSAHAANHRAKHNKGKSSRAGKSAGHRSHGKARGRR